MPESFKVFVTPSICGVILTAEGGMVSKMQFTLTMSEVLPRLSRVRTQIILAPSPLTSKLDPTPRVQVAPWSKENSQSKLGASTRHMPMRVMPSVTLKPVSVKVKTGALRVTGLGTSIGGWGEDSATGSVPGPDPPHAPKNKASAIDEAEREMSFFIHGIEI
jgi:hypothetical protein